MATFDVFVTPGHNLIRVYALIHSCVLSSLLNSRGARPDKKSRHRKEVQLVLFFLPMVKP